MYVHSYQSRLWNAAASHRIKTYGAENAVVGDLVLPSDATEASPDGACMSPAAFVYVPLCVSGLI